jgi:outer membrane protein OmpA-like peptidoglycan-associated protein
VALRRRTTPSLEGVAPETSAKTSRPHGGRLQAETLPNFDFDKATLKPDAAAVIAQIVTLMKDDPSLKLEISGHTAVVAAIVAQGIQAGRLSATGYGPDKPVADNGKEEGRAKNRRVELTKS